MEEDYQADEFEDASPGTDGQHEGKVSFWDRIRGAFNSGDEGDDEGSDEGDDGEADGASYEQVSGVARQRVADYYSSGEADRHAEQLQDAWYRGTPQYAKNAEIEHMERHLERAEECIRKSARPYEDEEFWAGIVGKTLAAIADFDKLIPRLEAEEERLKDLFSSGRISEQAYADKMHQLGKRTNRAITRMQMGGLGGSYDDIGDIADQSKAILEDGLAEDNGAMRQKIQRKIRSMPRPMALEIIAAAVEDGVISQKTADYLVVYYVRPH